MKTLGIVVAICVIECLVIGFATGWSSAGAAIFQVIGMLTAFIGGGIALRRMYR